MLKMLRKTMIERLIFIFQACINVEYHSKLFRKAKIIVLKKINRNDYTFFKIYKSIALLNTINKVLKSIIINKIAALTKRNFLLLKSQMSAKKKREIDVETANWRNTHNIKTKKKQNCHNHERKRDWNLRSRLTY